MNEVVTGEVSERHVALTVWDENVAWATAGPAAYVDPHGRGAQERTYETRTWDSPEVETGFAATELLPSWNASTPAGTWLRVEGRVHGSSGWSPWVTFACWADPTPDAGAPITRTTVPGQRGPWGRVSTDRLVAGEERFTRWQLRLTALRAEGAPEWPEVSLVGAVASALHVSETDATSDPGVGVGREITVPTYSQQRHVDTFPQWQGGGQSWCSPTSTTMLLDHWGRMPGPDETAWLADAVDPFVIHAVSRVFDEEYGGAGNWPFNTAYAATRGLRAYVTRLRGLDEAEQFIAAGIPLVVSVSFTEAEMDGAGYDTDGHLLTIVGFTPEGDVISNDPASHGIASNDEVRSVYRRDQFEWAWLTHGGGVTYVMHPRDVSLPTPPSGEPNWA